MQHINSLTYNLSVCVATPQGSDKDATKDMYYTTAEAYIVLQLPKGQIKMQLTEKDFERLIIELQLPKGQIKMQHSNIWR